MSLPGFLKLFEIKNELLISKKNISSTKNIIFIEKANDLSKIEWQIEDKKIGKLPLISLSANNLVCLIGKSGSGKSTLLDCFCGLYRNELSKWSLTGNSEFLNSFSNFKNQ